MDRWPHRRARRKGGRMNALALRGNRCRCTACGDYFNSIFAFDRHRVGNYSTRTSRRCLTVAELAARGWARNAAGFWITRPMPREAATVRVEAHRAPRPATTLQAVP